MQMRSQDPEKASFGRVIVELARNQLIIHEDNSRSRFIMLWRMNCIASTTGDGSLCRTRRVGVIYRAVNGNPTRKHDHTRNYEP